MKMVTKLLSLCLVPVWIYGVNPDLEKELDVNDEQFVSKLAGQAQLLYQELNNCSGKLTSEEQLSFFVLKGVTFNMAAQLKEVAQGSAKYPTFLNIINNPESRLNYYRKWEQEKQQVTILLNQLEKRK